MGTEALPLGVKRPRRDALPVSAKVKSGAAITPLPLMSLERGCLIK
jgi:hypothetical protein